MSYFKKRVKKIQIQNNCIFESQQKKSWKQKNEHTIVFLKIEKQFCTNDRNPY